MATQKAGFAAFLAGAGIGAAAEFLLDPRQGRRRRHMAIEKLSSRWRRGKRGVEQVGRRAAFRAKGIVAEATPPAHDPSELNDQGLAAKVESELFRPAGSPKGAVDVNVEKGVVFLRGGLESREQIEELGKRAGRIDGVRGVENLLHIAGEPAPTK